MSVLPPSSQEHLVAAVEALGEGVVVQDADGAIVAANPAAARILGLTADQLATRTSTDPRWMAIHPDGTPWPGEDHPSMRTLRTGTEEDGTVMGIRQPDGTLRWLQVATRLLSGGAGVVSTFADVTAQRDAEAALRASERRLAALFEHAPIAKLVVARDGTITLANPAAERLLGAPAAALRARTLQHHVTGDSAPLDAALAGATATELVECTLQAAGRTLVTELHLSRVEDGCLVQLLDVTDRRRIEDELRHYAYHDPLTGLRNRRWLRERLQEHLAVAERTGPESALLLCDIDDFKAINDRWGHDAGDDVLVAVARLLERHVRAGDAVVRLGGDELCVLMPRTTVAAARHVGRKLAAALADEPVKLGSGETVAVSLSFGAAALAPGARPRDVVRAADLELYGAKDRRRLAPS